MQTPLLYRLSRFFLRFVLSFYFRSLEIGGARHIRRAGPVVFAANHPQSIIDSFILGWAAGRMLHYLGHAGLFRSPIRRWFLRGSGVIPVYRRDESNAEASDRDDRNQEAFRESFTVLEKGGAIGIFPEGISVPGRKVQPMKTGAARIALGAEHQNGWKLGARIVPAGISFESAGRFRSRVLVVFGDAIEMKPWRAEYERDPSGAVQSVTALLEERISGLVTNVEFERSEIVRDLERVYREELATRPGLALATLSKFQREQLLSREIAKAVEHYERTDSAVVWEARRALRRYRGRLERLRISDRVMRAGVSPSPRRVSPSFRREVAKSVVIGIAGLPFAAYGAFWNILPYKLTGRLAARKAPDATQYHQYQILFGGLLYGLYYPPLFYWFYASLGALPTAVFALTLVPTGFFARWYGRFFAGRTQSVRFAYLSATRGVTIQKLRRDRALIVRRMDELVERYLRETGTELPTDPDRDERGVK
ncbi:MAG: hypothetical protein HKN20_01820 [Gemmatimonadetes bacterium]|nr:hypothetical protein [Gemmatimonadota bacterium]